MLNGYLYDKDITIYGNLSDLSVIGTLADIAPTIQPIEYQTITASPPFTFTSPQPQNLSNYKIYGATTNGASVGDLVSSGEHQGEYVIPVTVAKTGQSTTKNIYLSEPLHGATVYGIHLTPGESDYNIEYLENAVGKTPAGMNFSTGVFNYGGWENAFFMPRPCMLKYDGTVDYYLNPNDYTKKLDGTNSDIANLSYDGNAMMEWPKIWYKFAPGTVDGEGYFYVSDQKVDDSYHCWCNLDCNGSEIPHFYTPIYSCVQYNGKMRSICGFKQSTIAYSYYLKDYVTYASANNTTSNKEWYIETFCDRQLIDALLMLIGKTTKFQTVYGKGILESNAYHYTGDANDKGLFYGASTNNQALKIFGMEDWWGTRYRFLAGAMTIENTTDYMMQLLYKLTWSDLDGSTTTGYQEENYTNSSGYLTMGYKQVSLAQGGTDWKVLSKYFIFTNDLYRPYIASDDSNLSDLVEMGILFSNTARNQGFSIGGGQINDKGHQYPFTIYSQDMNTTTYQPNIVYRNGNISCKPAASTQTATQTASATADYIDYAQGKRYNMDGSQSAVTLPELSAYAGANTLSVGTTVQPSTVSITGRGISEE